MHTLCAETDAPASLNNALAAAAFSCADHPPAATESSAMYAGLKSAICLQCSSHALTRLWLHHGLQ